MASFTMKAAPRYASGSTVEVHPEDAFTLGGSAAAAAVTSAVVAAAGTVAFTGLAGYTRYVAAQLQSGRWVLPRFGVSGPNQTLEALTRYTRLLRRGGWN